MDTALTIPWLERVDDALVQAQATGKLAFLAFSQAPRCAGSVALERDVFPHERVASLILEHCVPARMIRSDAPTDAARYGIVWTPSFVIAEADGQERHRLVGYLPLDDFLAHVEIGLAKVAFGRDEFVAAEQAFAAVARAHPAAHAAPEAEYWAGVSRYKQDKDRQFLRAVAERLRDRYPSSEWTARASVWL